MLPYQYYIVQLLFAGIIYIVIIKSKEILIIITNMLFLYRIISQVILAKEKQNYMAQQLKNTSQVQQSQTNRPASSETQVTRLAKILQKQPESRSGVENQYIGNFIKQNVILSKLSEEFSFQFVKNLFKAAIIVTPRKDSLIYLRGQKIQEIGIVISGQLAILANEDSGDQPIGIRNDQVFQKLLQNAKMFTKQLRKKQSSVALLQLSNKRSHQNFLQKTYHPIDMYMSQPINPQLIDQYINQNEFFGFRDRSVGQGFLKTCVCLNDQTTLLLFKESNVMVSLEVSLKEKIRKIAGILKGISCFNVLDIEKLNLVIQNMNIKKKKKFEYIYKQGEESTSFYLLTQGEIKITKQTNLFEENPNDLYGNRKKLIQQTLTTHNRKDVDKVQKIFIDKKVKKSILPYANLTNMYNYRPMKKMIEIGVVTPFSLFGEEQYCEKKARDTNAMCFSLSSEYYEISVRKLEEIIGNKLLPIFEKELRDFVRKKVLYRQSHYANSIHLENNNNLDYFYLQDGKQKQSPRKFKITKFNHIISSSKQNSPQKKQQSTTASATFTTFNFNKMKNLTLSESRQKKHHHELEVEEEQQYEKNPNELKIMDMTHTWKLMKEKVDMEIKASQKISPFKPTINLKKPLIASEYFFHVEKQSKRIQRQHRKRIASLSRSYRLTRAPEKN